MMRNDYCSRPTYPIPEGEGLATGPRPGQVAARAFLVAVGRTVEPPMFAGDPPLQRMRVIVMVPGDGGGPRQRGVVLGPLPSLAAPPDRGLLPPTASRAPARPVRGEILRDGKGRLYERVGHAVRPIGRLASAPGGEVYDLAGEAGPVDAGSMQPQAATPRPPQESRRAIPARGDEGHGGAGGRAVPQDAVPPRGRAVPPFRALLPDPGHWCVMPYREVKELIGSQLTHPERLREDHQLPCYVQVYEANTATHVTAIARTLLGDPRAFGQLRQWSASTATRFQLRLAPPPHAETEEGARGEPGMVAAGDRFFRLQVAADPTADPAPAPEPARSTGPARPEPVAPKTAIPECFLSPWHFKLEREEAVYDMGSQGQTRPWRSLTRLFGRAVSKGERRKWETLLRGRTLDEQLWAVPLPKRGLRDRALREWARQTLALAGYEAGQMLTEWEIFWRRRGCE